MISKTIIRLITSVFLVAISAHLSLAQNEWESVSPSYFKWGTNSQLIVTSSSLSNLTVWNPHAEPRVNKRNNNWQYEDIVMNISWKETRPWKITFAMWNENNRSDYKYRVYDEDKNQTWHTGNVYWGYSITVNNLGGKEEYSRYYCDLKQSTSYNNRGTCDSIEKQWRLTNDSYSNRFVTITYDGNNTINVTDYGYSHTFYGANSISSIRILVGTAAEVHVGNFTAQRQTAYADIKPYITSGDSKYKNNDYWGAIEDYTKAIEKGYKTYDIYFKRASAYYAIEFFSNAIVDFTNAISYKETEDAYLYRGLAKLYKDDVSGIEDLKKGGTKGQALVREFETEVENTPRGPIQQSKYKASGTGFFIDPRGYIATNNHVVDGFNGFDVFVTKQGKTTSYRAHIVVVDKVNDLAILKVDDPGFTQVSSIPYSIASGTSDVGAKVFAMGYPEISSLGEEIKVTDGIISSKTGYQGDITTYQISAPIQHGSSGGALFDMSGNVIGVTNAGIEQLQNVGYAIKSSYLINLIDASPEIIQLPTSNQLGGAMSLPEKIKRISPFVVIIKTYYESSTTNQSGKTDQQTNTIQSKKTTTTSTNSSQAKVHNSYVSLYINEYKQLVLNHIQGDVSYRWESDDPLIASVTQRGRVTGQKAGKTTIWVKDPSDNIVACFFITVNSTQQTQTTKSVTNTRTSESRNTSGSTRSSNSNYISLTIGERQRLSIKDPERGISYSWESDDPQIASISQDGVVTGHRLGKTTIWVKDPSGINTVYFITVRNSM